MRDATKDATKKTRVPRDDLVGAGRSQLGVDKAMRGRDVNRPTQEDMARAEKEVVIARRNWRPADASQAPQR